MYFDCLPDNYFLNCLLTITFCIIRHKCMTSGSIQVVDKLVEVCWQGIPKHVALVCQEYRNNIPVVY